MMSGVRKFLFLQIKRNENETLSNVGVLICVFDISIPG